MHQHTWWGDCCQCFLFPCLVSQNKDPTRLDIMKFQDFFVLWSEKLWHSIKRYFMSLSLVFAACQGRTVCCWDSGVTRMCRVMKPLPSAVPIHSSQFSVAFLNKEVSHFQLTHPRVSGTDYSYTLILTYPRCWFPPKSLRNKCAGARYSTLLYPPQALLVFTSARTKLTQQVIYHVFWSPSAFFISKYFNHQF